MTSPNTPRPPDGRAARWAGQRDRRRREFVEAGLRAITRHGPEVSTEQIADEAGVARTRLYRHFDGAADLQHAIACRVAELITAEFAPLWQPSGTPMDLIRTAIGAHTRWLAEHGPLYRYLTKHAVDGAPDVFADGKTAIARQLTVVFEHYLGLFGVDTRVCEAVAFGLVGLVETSTARWLENPRGVDRAELAALLAHWVWGIVDDTLRRGGLELDPHTRLEAADLSARSTVDS